MLESEQGFEAIPKHIRDRVVRLAATEVKELEEKYPRLVMLDGIEKAIDYFPATFSSPADKTIARRFIADLNDWDIDAFSDIEPYSLNKEEMEMFINCGGGINEKTGQALKSFYHGPEIKPD